MAAMNDFLADYAAGKAQARYIDAELPNLPFPDLSFDLGLCSHFLFLYTTQLGETFHQRAIREMCRVASEVRIFPLVALGSTSSHCSTQSWLGVGDRACACRSRPCRTNSNVAPTR
jgi:hypothetical protein